MEEEAYYLGKLNIRKTLAKITYFLDLNVQTCIQNAEA